MILAPKSCRLRHFAGTAPTTGLALAPLPGWAQQGGAASPGGKLDLTLTGFAKFDWIVGDQTERRGGRQSRNDFRNDTEVHVKLQGRDEGSGIVCGAGIEREADTNKPPDANET